MPLWGYKAQPLGVIRHSPEGLQGASLNRCKAQHFLGMGRTSPLVSDACMIIMIMFNYIYK